MDKKLYYPELKDWIVFDGINGRNDKGGYAVMGTGKDDPPLIAMYYTFPNSNISIVALVRLRNTTLLEFSYDQDLMAETNDMETIIKLANEYQGWEYDWIEGLSTDDLDVWWTDILSNDNDLILYEKVINQQSVVDYLIVKAEKWIKNREDL